MTSLAAAPKKYTVAEYLEIERTTGEKHAYYNGTIEPVAGASIPRNRITRNILTELCKIFEKNQVLKPSAATKRSTSPGANIACIPMPQSSRKNRS